MANLNQQLLSRGHRTRSRVKLEKELAPQAAARAQALESESIAARLAGDNASAGPASPAGSSCVQVPVVKVSTTSLPPSRGHSSLCSSASSDEMLETQKKVPLLEQRKILSAPKTVAEGLYHHITTDTILELLETSPMYDCVAKRWAGIPEVASDEEDILNCFEAVFIEILNRVGKVDDSREIIRSKGMQLHHAEDAFQFSEPTFSVAATGPSFCHARRMEGKSSLGYSNIASVFDVRMDRSTEGIEDVVERVAMHNRQIIIHQPNRLFARSLIITESSVRLLHSDRSGSFYTDEVDIHKDPYTFVRLVVGLSPTNEEDLGLDTSVQWTAVDGKRVSGTLMTFDGDGNPITYNLNVDELRITRYTVHGRGTICWRAQDKDGKRVIIKDAWRSEGAAAEVDFLEMAKGLRGVVQMLGHEDMRGQTKVYRPGSSLATVQENRILSRVVLEEYGSSIAYFKSELQILLALRDAIIAHRALFQRGVLHRDVSISNILLDEHRSPLKGRDVNVHSHLIDLDMAILLDPERKSTPSRTVGTRLYQSISVLQSYSHPQPKLAHDYLDDLESFLYILLHLVYGFSGPGEALPSSARAEFLDAWETATTASAARQKLGFMVAGADDAEPASFWSKSTVTLSNDLRRFLCPIILLTVELSNTKDVEERSRGIAKLHKKWEKHYEGIIELFDDAIEEARAATPRPTSDVCAEDFTATKLRSKRALKDDGDYHGERGVKRAKGPLGR